MAEQEHLDDYRENNRCHRLPVDNPRHTEVLGERVSTAVGKSHWDQLDWNHWRIDHATEGHIFGHASCAYFHVRTNIQFRGRWDGTVYRVRCWYAGGTYRGWPVISVGIGQSKGKFEWIVHTQRLRFEPQSN